MLGHARFESRQTATNETKAPGLLVAGRGPAWSAALRNDLETPVVRHHPAIGRIRQSLLDAGAAFAAMSGSGSAVFGLFERADAARRTANDLARPGWLSLHTRTLNRRDYARRVAAGL